MLNECRRSMYHFLMRSMPCVYRLAPPGARPFPDLRARVIASIKMVAALMIVGLLSGVPKTAVAQTTSTGLVTINNMGCGVQGGGGCFVYISGPNVGPAGCNTNSIRWDPAAPNGQIALAQLTAAFVAGRQVNFVLADTCWSPWPSYPTMWYYVIY